MTPKKSTSQHKTKALVKKPSPRKMTQSPSSSGKSRRKKNLGVFKKFRPDTSHTSSVETPAPSETSSVPLPRSSERYNFRSITPPSSKTNAYFTPGRTPLRTPSGMLRRTPGRKLGRTPIATPFRTPRIRPVEKEPEINHAEAFKLHKDEGVTWKQHLKLITSKVHKVCYLSTMSNFKYEDKLLKKKYENHLKNKVLEVFPSAMLTVSLSTTSCLTLDPQTVDAVRIEIESLTLGETTDEDVTVTVYGAWLFRTDKTQTEPRPGLEWFPVMFYTGREAIHHVVIDWLQGSFGCYITKFGIRQYDLMWIVGVWSGRLCPLPSHQSKENLMVDFMYHIHPPAGKEHLPIPNQRGKPRITTSVNLKDIQHIWKHIVDSSSNQMKEEEVCEYASTMDSLAEKVTMIPRYLLQLYRLQTPCISVCADGRVRVPCRKSIRIIVNHLTDIFLQILITNESTKEMTSDMNGHLTASMNDTY
ncbi:centromere protein L-like isoform X1 [Palaemon carinicauda]|uniref:centromere protein L-like isoform X1 n=1 Tax=Palaemon carinicauda TaxID=392227 RepID=UPI0035B5FC10